MVSKYHKKELERERNLNLVEDAQVVKFKPAKEIFGGEMTMRGILRFWPKNELTERLIRKLDLAAKTFSTYSDKVFGTRRRRYHMGEGWTRTTVRE